MFRFQPEPPCGSGWRRIGAICGSWRSWAWTPAQRWPVSPPQSGQSGSPEPSPVGLRLPRATEWGRRGNIGLLSGVVPTTFARVLAPGAAVRAFEITGQLGLGYLILVERPPPRRDLTPGDARDHVSC